MNYEAKYTLENGDWTDVIGYNRPIPPLTFVDYNTSVVPLAFEFTKYGEQLGKLWFKDGVLHFEGNADESAEKFFETFQNLINSKYVEACKERDDLKAELEALKLINAELRDALNYYKAVAKLAGSVSGGR
jgi:hypothetical protein